MVTHDIELLDLVDRVVSLESGKVVFDGEPANFPVPEIPTARRSSPHRRSPMDLTPDAPDGGSPPAPASAAPVQWRRRGDPGAPVRHFPRGLRS